MKVKLNMGEYAEYLSHHMPGEIKFFSGNQNDDKHATFNLSFNYIVAFDNPSLIYLRSPGGELYFECVDSVEVDTDTIMAATIVTISCNREKEKYVLLAR